MDMVAAIQAAKNQLEEQKKKKGTNKAPSQSLTSPLSISHIHPAPPTNIVSFDSKRRSNAGPHPYHTNNNSGDNNKQHGDYIHPDYTYSSNQEGEYAYGEDDDELTTTSSLSGTLPSSVVHDIPSSSHVGSSVGHSLNRVESGLSNSGLYLDNFKMDTVKEDYSPGNANAARSKSFVAVEKDDDVTPSRRSRSFYTAEAVPLPLGGANTGSNNNTVGNNNAVAANNNANSNNNNSNAVNTTNVSKRIDEIMSAYQGKVDTILKRRDEGTSFKTIIESASSAAGGVGGTNVAANVGGGSVASSSVEKLGIDDIMDTYKKKVGEIMEKQHSFKRVGNVGPSDDGGANNIQQQQSSSSRSSSSHSSDRENESYNHDMELKRQELSARTRPSYPRSIVDDEEFELMESREGAVDIRSCQRGENSDGSQSENSDYNGEKCRGDEGSYSNESGSYSSQDSGAREGRRALPNGNDDVSAHMSTSTPASGAAGRSGGPMSERANAIWKSIDSKQTATNTASSDVHVNESLSSRHNSLSPIQDREAQSIENDRHDNRKNYSNQESASIYSEDEESYSSRDSYISGASSASNALSAQIEGQNRGPIAYNSETNATNDHDVTATSNSNSNNNNNNNTSQQDTPKPTTLHRKNSLHRAQEQLAKNLQPTSSKSFHHEHNSTKTNLHAEIESERKYRQDLEKRLAESTAREEELSNENARMDKTNKELQSALDKVQGDARNNKFEQSELAARVRELERKLKGEQNRVEELEREKDVMKEEYDADLEEQKDINRQLEQMVMSEEFEKELEDEINQVKELEHANRRFKVKIDMLEREKNTIVKKFEVKIDELSQKNKTLEDQLSEFESKANALESSNRNTVMELEAKLAAETSRTRELELSLDSAVSKYNTKAKSLEAEMEELRQSSSKIDEYEQVLGKLMERNAELEAEAKEARDERDMANRQVELSDRRRAVKVKDLQEQVAEQKLMIEQQQETLEESVKTILKLYSLNNGKGDDMTELSEEQLDSITRAMIPRTSSKSISERPQQDRPWSRGRGRFDELDKSVAKAVERAKSRGRDRFDDLEADKAVTRAQSRGRDRFDDMEVDSKVVSRAQSRGRDRFDELDAADKSVARSMVRARSQARDRFEEMSTDKPVARAKSRGRGDRSESIRQLTSRALDSGKERSRSPLSRRMSSSDNIYDPAGPNSLALVPITPKDTDDRYYGGSTTHGSSRRGGSSAYDRVESTYTDGSSYSNAIIPYNEYDGTNRPRHRSNYHQHDRNKGRYGDRDDRSRSGRSHRERGDDRRRDRVDDDRSRGGRSHREERHRDKGGSRGGEPPRRRDGRHRGQTGYHEEEYGSRRATRDSAGYVEDSGRQYNRERQHRPRGDKRRSNRDP